ncbi:MAG TPA: response regulator [Polyangiaceae bacterium]|nr:response regulator [Polyangiaceae bacterium]
MSKVRLGEPWGPFFSEAALPCFVFLREEGGFVLEAVNRAWQEATGLSPDEVLGLSPSDFLPAALATELENRLAQCLARRESASHDQGLALPQATRFWRTLLTPWPENEPQRVLCVAFDISDEVRAKRDLEQREEQQRVFETKLLETQKLESLGVLAGSIAHDFNNLLTGILGTVSLIRNTLPEATPNREHVERIERAAVQAADLCRQMLAYSGKGRLTVRRVDLSELVREMAPLLEVSIGKSAVLDLRLEAGPPAISGDASQLRQVVMNLLSNAAEALVGGAGTISICTSSLHATREELANALHAPNLNEGRFVCLEISDTGAGMSAETVQRIFDPLYTTKVTGRGLGLPAVLAIVRGHQGAIKVHSEPGRGTTFKLFLPVVEAVRERSSVSSRAGKGYRGSGTILIVDDEEVVRSVAARILQSFGFKALSAADGIEGLSRFRAHAEEIGAVLLDLTMPGMDGEAVFRELRAIRANVRVLLMSGFNEQDAIARFAGKGLAGFLQKPFTLEQLIEKLRGVLEGPLNPE